MMTLFLWSEHSWLRNLEPSPEEIKLDSADYSNQQCVCFLVGFVHPSIFITAYPGQGCGGVGAFI